MHTRNNKTRRQKPEKAIDALKLIALERETLAPQCIQEISQLADKAPRSAVGALKLIALKRKTLAHQCLQEIITAGKKNMVASELAEVASARIKEKYPSLSEDE